MAYRIGVDAQVIKRLERGVGSVATLTAVMSALDFRLIGIASGTSLSEQLRSQLHRRSLSLDALASRTGLSRTTIASLERGGGSVASLVSLLAVLALNVRRRAPERVYRGLGDKQDRDSRFTPANIYDAFGEVDLNPCGNALSPVVATQRILLSGGGDGLADAWSGRLAFVKPPYSELLRWLRCGNDQWLAGHVETIVCLIPVRTDSSWFHETLSKGVDIYLLKGRVRFLNPEGRGQHTSFSLMPLTLGTTADQRRRYEAVEPGFWLARRASTSGA